MFEYREMSLVDPALNTIHVLETAQAVRFVQLHLDGRGIGAGVGRVQGGEIRHDTNIRNDQLKIFRLYCRVGSGPQLWRRTDRLLQYEFRWEPLG